MSYGIVLVFEGVTEEHYWAVNEHLGVRRDGTGDWPAGILNHFAGASGDRWVVVERWDSKAAHEAFMAERLGAALAAAGVPAPVQILELDTVNDRQLV